MTICSTDDRYADDVHYRGGCVLALDMLHWASSMLTWNARPPDPRLYGEGWREAWRERLETLTPWIEHWLGHQRRDAYWKHGSVCEDYAAIECPVYAVGGFADGYTNAVPRLLAGLSGPRKGIIGPWAHAFPEDALPGPSIGFLQETRALVRPLAEGDRHRDHGRADAARLDAGLGRAAADLRRPPGPLGGRGGVALAAHRHPRRGSCRWTSRAALARRPVLRDGGGRLVRRGPVRRPRRRPAARRRALARLRLGAARASRSRSSASPRPCSSWRSTGRARSSPSASATSSRTAPRRS